MTSRVVVFFLILASPAALSQPLILSETERIEAYEFIRYLRDPSGKQTWPSVQHADFKPHKINKPLNFGFTSDVYWFTFDVKNESQEEKWVIEIPFSPLDQIDLYYEGDEPGQYIHRIGGDKFPVSVREVRYQHTVFVINIPSGSVKKFFIRLQSTSSVQLPMIFWKHDAFFQNTFTIHLFNGLFYGAMMLMLVSQLLLYAFMRERVILYYMLTLLGMLNIVSFFQGYSFLYLYPEHPSLSSLLAILGGPIFIFTSTLLTRTFLDLAKHQVWLDRLLIVNSLADVVLAIMMILSKGSISYRYHHHAVLAHCVLVLISAGYCLADNYRPARYYLLSWVTLLIAALMFSMSNLGLFPEYLSTNYTGLMVGCILQMLFIASALGDRWKMMLRENQQAKELELIRNQRENERLEKEVKLRIDEIQLKNEKLEEVNRVKDKLFSIVSHDIKGPLSSLQLALTLMKGGGITQAEFEELSAILELRFAQTSEFVQNLLQWAALQLKGVNFEPASIDLQNISSETVSLLEFEWGRKEVLVHNRIDAGMIVFADVNMLRSIFRNLLTNAIKFTSKGGHITLNAVKEDDEWIKVSVQDTGVGIPKKNQEKLFSLEGATTTGTGAETGTGLGLMLCKEFVERNGGRIWLESEEGKGTVFFFTLPIMKTT
jgi:signal transduction histidine kinase